MMKKAALLLLAAIIATTTIASAGSITARNESGHCAWITQYGTRKPFQYHIIRSQWLKPGERVTVPTLVGFDDNRFRAEVMVGAACSGHRIYDTDTKWDDGDRWSITLKKGNGNYYFVRTQHGR